jgi:predicted TIM-barrel fold metal-dependent hydrolase
MRVVAVEEHCVTPELRQLLGRQIHPYYPANAWPEALEARLMDIGENRLAEMDSMGVDVQLLSIAQPGLEHSSPARAIPVARAFNESIADAVAAHPTRFGGLAALPTSAPDAAAAELERAVASLRLHGAMINGRTQERFLDDQFFWPIFESAEALGVPLYLHPTPPSRGVYDAYYSGFGEEIGFSLAGGAWGWHVETGLHAVRLMLAGVFDRFPTLQLVLGHMGEVLPFMVRRTSEVLQGQRARAEVAKRMELSVAEYVRRNVYVSTSGFYSDAALRCAIEAVGEDRVMFSVDYPFADGAAARTFLEETLVTDEQRRKIACENADRLFGLQPPSA